MNPDPSPSGPPSAQQRFVHAYYETTSAGGLIDADRIDHDAATAGLRRGLRDWLDVKDRHVVDLGCGTGELCWLARRAGARSVTGVNLSPGEIARAQSYVQARFVCLDVVEYLRAQPDASVDRIFALNLLEHLDKDTLVALLEQSARCLAPGGALTAMVPNAISSFGTMTRYWDITHQLAFTPSSVRQLMRLCGFRDCGFREWGPRPHGVVSTARFALWQGIRAATAIRLLVETGSAKGGVYTADMLFRLSR
jgi:cyclopropane fatty-acyl-phospholipid synthase-like methyltransferase